LDGLVEVLLEFSVLYQFVGEGITIRDSLYDGEFILIVDFFQFRKVKDVISVCSQFVDATIMCHLV
jgi:hypothetical protein